jgi:hypothetical protein
MTARSLAVLTAIASPVIGAAAVVGWLAGVWPATPLTFMLSAAAVVGGPLVALVHVATAGEGEPAQPARARPAAPPRPRVIPLDAVASTPRLVAARQFHDWRERENDALTRREREELLRRNQYLARRLRRARAL